MPSGNHIEEFQKHERKSHIYLTENGMCEMCQRIAILYVELYDKAKHYIDNIPDDTSKNQLVVYMNELRRAYGYQ